MRKYFFLTFVLILSIIIFSGVYYITNSWKLSLAIVVIALIYLIWVIGFELGLSDSKSKKEKTEKMLKSQKEEHTKMTKDNPTLR